MVIKILCTTLALLAVSIAACGDDDDDEPNDQDSEATQPAATVEADDDEAPDGASAAGEVAIQDFAFNPADLQVNVGDTVTWTNLDTTSHTVTADDGAFASGSVGGEETFEFTFDTAGEFAYHCDFHPGMTATVTVGEGAASPTDDGDGQPISLGDGY